MSYQIHIAQDILTDRQKIFILRPDMYKEVHWSYHLIMVFSLVSQEKILGGARNSQACEK